MLCSCVISGFLLQVGVPVIILSTKGDQPEKGRVKYLGATSFAHGSWIGVELDSAQGRTCCTSLIHQAVLVSFAGITLIAVHICFHDANQTTYYRVFYTNCCAISLAMDVYE